MKVRFIEVYRVWRKGEWLLTTSLLSAQLLHQPYKPDWKPGTVLVECAMVGDEVIIPNTVSRV
jgi:hypothetical protein